MSSATINSSQPAASGLPTKTLDSPPKSKPTPALSPRVTIEAASLAAIAAMIPPAIVALTGDTWMAPLYGWMRGRVCPGRELDAVEYVLRQRGRLITGEWDAVDLRAKVLASFSRPEFDGRVVLAGIADEWTSTQPPQAAGADNDEAEIVLAYHRAATGLDLSPATKGMVAAGVNVAVDTMLTPPRHGPHRTNPLAALRNAGRASSRGSRLTDLLQDRGLPPLAARSLARMLAGTAQPTGDGGDFTSLLYCATTRFDLRSLSDRVVIRWGADAADLDPVAGTSRAQLRRAARGTVIKHRRWLVGESPPARHPDTDLAFIA